MAANVQQQVIQGGTPVGGISDSTTFLPLQVDNKVPPLFKMDNRWEYLKEYIYEFWMVGKKAQMMAVAYAVLGLLTIKAVPLGAMLLFLLAGRYQNIAWWGNGVATKFGRGRTLVLLN